MKTLAELLAARKIAVEAAEKMEADAAAADGVMTEEQTTQFDAYIAESKQLTAQIERKQALVPLREAAETAPGRMTAPASPAQEPGPSVPAAAAAPDPTRGFSSPRAFMLAVLDAGRFGRQDSRLSLLAVDEAGQLMATVGSDEQGGYSGAAGGFLVPEAFSPNLIAISAQGDPLAGLVTRVPMTAPVVKFAARVDKDHSSSVSGGLRFYRRAETAEVTSSRMTFEELKLIANPLMGVAYATQEILMDSPTSFAALLAAGFQDEYASKIMDERLRGTGAGEFEGILNSPALINVAKESSQAAATIVTANILKMRVRAWKYSECVWLTVQDAIVQFAQLYIYAGAGGIPTPIYDSAAETLLGRPIHYVEEASALGTTGDIICFNPREYYEGDYQPLTGAESIHVRFLANESCFRFTARNDGRLAWRTALTPKNGATRSPVVTLATRG